MVQNSCLVSQCRRFKSQSAYEFERYIGKSGIHLQFSSRWYLCARKSPYALHRVSQKFPRRRLWLKRFQFYSSDCMTMALSRPFKEDCLASASTSSTSSISSISYIFKNKTKNTTPSCSLCSRTMPGTTAQAHCGLLAPFPQTLSELHVRYTPSKAGATHPILICAHLSVCRTRTYN